MATKKHSSTGINETSSPVLTLVKQPSKPPAKTSAKRLRASIIEGTLGEDVGSWPPLPAYVQRVVDEKARELASEARDLIHESIVRQIGIQCFRGRAYEIFDDDNALEIVRHLTLDNALAPIVRLYLDRIRRSAKSLVSDVTGTMDMVDETLKQFK